MIIQYVRDENRNPRAVVVAVKLDTQHFGIGWAKCNLKKDTFTKKMGLMIAKARAERPQFIVPCVGISDSILRDWAVIGKINRDIELQEVLFRVVSRGLAYFYKQWSEKGQLHY